MFADHLCVAGMGRRFYILFLLSSLRSWSTSQRHSHLLPNHGWSVVSRIILLFCFPAPSQLPLVFLFWCGRYSSFPLYHLFICRHFLHTRTAHL
ncbi:hypothetical protein BJ165DRAFT_1482720 [Panaeolus papilionaceus]|nr:hypothetical protein BJ165DRAFT_1482720 [Panaeolus papilionaceus]